MSTRQLAARSCAMDRIGVDTNYVAVFVISVRRRGMGSYGDNSRSVGGVQSARQGTLFLGWRRWRGDNDASQPLVAPGAQDFFPEEIFAQSDVPLYRIAS